MLYNFSNLNQTTLLMQKNFNISKNTLLTFLFLTNNHSFYFVFFNFYKILPSLNLIKTFFKIKIKKNNFFFFKLYSRFRNFFNFNKYIFKPFLRNNRFLVFNLKSKNINLRKKFFLNHFLKKNLTCLHYKNNFFKNWNYLIGSPISPFNTDLFANKKIFRKDLKLVFVQNRLFFNFFNKNFSNYKMQRKKSNINFSKTSFFKKIFINNFFYLNKKKVNYNQLSYLLKNKNKKKYKIKMSKNWLLTKPYMFLNNSYNWKLYKYYSNYYLFSIFKNYFKIFKKIKKFKFRFKFKKTSDLSFKKNFFYKNNLFKFSNNYFHKIFIPFRKTPLLFVFRSSLIPQSITTRFFKFNKFIKINLKKKLKIFSFSRLIRKSVFLKKNKIYSNLLLHRNSLISSFFNTFLNKTKKLPRRLKKINMLSRLTITFFKTYYFFAIIPNWCGKIINFLINSSYTNSIFNRTSNFQFISKNLNKKFLQWRSFCTFSDKFLLKLKFINKNSLFLPNSLIFMRKKKIMKKKLFFITKEKTFFIANKLNFLFINDYSIFSFFKEKFFYNIKKLHYSFLYKNELQRYVLKRYSKFSFLNKYVKNDFLRDRLNQDMFNTKDYFSSLIENTNYSNSIYFILNKQIYSSNKWIYLKNQINFSKNYIKDEYNFNIKRVKFKPGYMTIWRDSRTVLKNTLSLSFRYQHRLTKYLSKYNKFVKFKTYLIIEMAIFNVLLKTKFFLNESICSSFLKNNLIYLNGFVCNNHKTQLFIGDFVQLIINNKYYILYKWFLNISITKKRKLKQILKKKINISFDTVEKKKSNRLPHSILFNKNSIGDVSKYLEVDYFTLSAFVLYEPFLWSDINVYNLINYRFGIINLYNWKYIT